MHINSSTLLPITTFTLFLALIGVFTAVACSPAKQQPPPDLEATVEARLEATAQAGVTQDQHVNATVQATIAERTPPPTKFSTPILPPPTLAPPPSPTLPPTLQTSPCDHILRRELVLQPNANITSRFNQVVKVIQSRDDHCTPTTWSPLAVDIDPTNSESCTPYSFNVIHADIVTDFITPDRNHLTPTSGRDNYDNIIVHWNQSPGNTPTDSAKCWLYISELATWFRNERDGTPIPYLLVTDLADGQYPKPNQWYYMEPDQEALSSNMLLFNVNYFCRLASIILAGSPPYPDPAAGPPRSGSWGRRIPG